MQATRIVNFGDRIDLPEGVPVSVRNRQERYILFNGQAGWIQGSRRRLSHTEFWDRLRFLGEDEVWDVLPVDALGIASQWLPCFPQRGQIIIEIKNPRIVIQGNGIDGTFKVMKGDRELFRYGERPGKSGLWVIFQPYFR
jgi:hypothetical protein